MSITELAAFQQDGRPWVIIDDADRPVAYLLFDVVEGNAHVEQVSVPPDHAGQGFGRRSWTPLLHGPNTTTSLS